MLVSTSMTEPAFLGCALHRLSNVAIQCRQNPARWWHCYLLLLLSIERVDVTALCFPLASQISADSIPIVATTVTACHPQRQPALCALWVK